MSRLQLFVRGSSRTAYFDTPCQLETSCQQPCHIEKVQLLCCVAGRPTEKTKSYITSNIGLETMSPMRPCLQHIRFRSHLPKSSSL